MIRHEDSELSFCRLLADRLAPKSRLPPALLAPAALPVEELIAFRAELALAASG